jgi:FkbM family methyltransferase
MRGSAPGFIRQFEDSSLISYAQNFEDVMLARVFAGRNTGFYVDVGAADPVNLSVTKWFYDLGWSGLNLEPNRQLFDRLAADRPRDINLDCGAGAAASEAQFFEPEVGELSSFDSRILDSAQNSGVPGTTRAVTVVPLTDLLKLHCPGRAIDFLKIDVEGWEAEVLKGLDLRQYRPIVILVEATVPQTSIESHMEWEPGVLNADYSFVYFDGVNRFYLANEHADLKEHFAVPPNVFDDFETFPLVRARTDAKQRLEAMHKLESFIQERDATIRKKDVVISNLLNSKSILRLILSQWTAKFSAKRLQRAQSSASLDASKLRTIVVDLTPVLPGGENGGAKVFVLELLRRLAEHAPHTQFVLLTQATAHDELAALDRENVRRLMILDPSRPPALRSLWIRIFSRVLAHLPGRLQRVAGRLGYALLTLSKRSGSRSLMRDLNVDLLFCPFTAPTYFEPDVPTVCVVYDLQYKAYPEFFSPEDVAHRGRTFIDAVRRSTALVAISDYSREVAIAEGKLDPASIKTVHLHISQHSLRNATRDESILSRLRLTAGKYLIYPANFWKHKNHEMLLTAFGLARRGGLADDIRLVCTGAPGERQQWLQRSARELGLENQILFPGYLANAELLALITNSAGVIFPSLYEGFGLPVVEAMATGVPVACSNVTSLPEVAGDAAILFDPRIPEQIAQAIISLAHDKELTSRLVQAGNLRAAQFSDSRLMAQQYWEIFEQATRMGGQSDVLFGEHPDGWVGPHLRLQVAPSEQSRTLDLEIALPNWAPIPKVKMLVQQNGQTKGEVTVLRGHSGTVSIPLPSGGGYFDINSNACFVPALTTRSNDQRELSAMLTKCSIAGLDGHNIVLFSQNAPT